MQPIATTNANADVMRLGKKYGNLQNDSGLENENQHIIKILFGWSSSWVLTGRYNKKEKYNKFLHKQKSDYP